MSRTLCLANPVHHFAMSSLQLQDIARTFASRLREGLFYEGRELRCFPTFLPPPASETTASERREAYVVDVGGSNVRAAVVAREEGKLSLVADPVVRPMPWKAGQPLDAESFFAFQQEALEAMGVDGERPLGYCFSYPAESTPRGDARLLKWTKEIEVPELVGQCVGERLVEHLHQRSTLRCSRVTVINDTVASLLAGLSGPPQDAHCGLIVGTGFNLASFFDAAAVPKARAHGQGPFPVNIEAGNFSPPWLTEWDDAVDGQSRNPGEQRFEKAISGGYLGHLAEAVLEQDASLPNAAALTRILAAPTTFKERQVEVAQAIYGRSAGWVAAALAGLVLVLSQHRPLESLRVTAEGGLFWGSVGERRLFADTTSRVLRGLLDDLELSPLQFEIVRQEHANLFGAAQAVLG